MSLHLNFKLTQAGQMAMWNTSNTGSALNLTHVQLGSGRRTPDGSETTLLQAKQTAAIAAGFSVSPTQIRMTAIFGGASSYPICEIGLWTGDPSVANSTAKLIAYWSQSSGDLAAKSRDVDFIFSHDMVLDNAVPAGDLTILADNGQSALLALISAHEAKSTAHAQYVEKSALQQQSYTALTTQGSAPNFLANANPALTSYQAGQRFRVTFHSSGSGNDTLNLNTLGAKSLKQYDAVGNKIAALISANRLTDIEYDGSDWVVRDAWGTAATWLSALPLPIIDHPSGMLPLSANALAGQGGTISVSANTPFTLGVAVAPNLALVQNCLTPSWNSPALLPNTEYFLRAQWIGNLLTFYVQRGNLNDTPPASQKGSVDGNSGGGFYSTPLDICCARILTGAAGSVPTVQKVIHRRTLTWSVTLNGSGTTYLPIDPFTKTGRVTVSNVTPHATAITQIEHGSGGWTYAAYWFGYPSGAGGNTPLAASAIYASAPILTSNNYIGDATVTTSTAMFEHISGQSMWQLFEVEHRIGDTTGASADEHLLGLGTKNMLPADYDNGLAIRFSNAVNVLLTWEIVR